MKITLLSSTAIGLLQAANVFAHEIDTPNLLAYIKAQKARASTGCNLDDEVAGWIDMPGCSKAYYFERVGGDDEECVYMMGQTRSNGLLTFSGVKSADGCADTCMNEPDVSRLATLLGMNYSCEDEICYW
eukprot:g13529.t1.1.5e17418b g13529  g13529.t1 contig8:871041-871572(+)